MGDERVLADETRGATPRAAASELAHPKKRRRERKPAEDSANADMRSLLKVRREKVNNKPMYRLSRRFSIARLGGTSPI
jgi:hypothetical protein